MPSFRRRMTKPIRGPHLSVSEKGRREGVHVVDGPNSRSRPMREKGKGEEEVG